MPELKDFLSVTPLIAFFVICAWVALKALPTWKEVKLAEVANQKEELEVRKAENVTLGNLNSVYEELLQQTEELKIFLKVAVREQEEVKRRLTGLEGLIDQVGGDRRDAQNA